MRTGGDNTEITPYANYINSGPATVTVTPVGGTLIAPNLPPPPPAGVLPWQYYRALNRWQNYMVDTSNPWLHIQFNGLVDLPFGRGQRFLRGANKALNEVVGGWQIAGDGSVIGQEFTVDSSNWGPSGPLHIYKHHTITDCRSGNCRKSMERFNGYIPPTAIAGNACSAGLANVVYGLSSGEVPYQTPIDTICSAPSGDKAVVDKYFGQNEVIMNGVTGQKANAVIGYGINSPANPYSHTVLNGPSNYNADLSLFKVVPITEQIYLRVNVHASAGCTCRWLGCGFPVGAKTRSAFLLPSAAIAVDRSISKMDSDELSVRSTLIGGPLVAILAIPCHLSATANSVAAALRDSFARACMR